MNADPMERLPCEVWVEVLEYGCLEEALKVHDLSETLERACCLVVRRKMVALRGRLAGGLPQWRSDIEDLPASYDSLRMSTLKSVVLLRYLVSEVNILFSTVWSYSEHVRAWIFLCPHLLPVIDEFDNLFKNSMNNLRREELTTFNMRMQLNTYHEFLRKYDSELVERLLDITRIQNFETEAMDILLCCPSINFQLSLSCRIVDNRFYDISSFFGFYNLKPVFQVPDVHNSSLTNEMKKTTILRYLRECVQWENLTFLQSIVSEINDLEYRVGFSSITDDMRFHLILKLSARYEDIQRNPYPTLYRHASVIQKGRDKLLEENYYRLSSCNANMTGLNVSINMFNQPPESLPLVIHQFRGQVRPVVDKVLDADEGHQSLLDRKAMSRSDGRSDLTHSLQLCINYREGFNSCPAESIIDVVYDHRKECHISSNYIESEPFQQFDLNIDTDEE